MRTECTFQAGRLLGVGRRREALRRRLAVRWHSQRWQLRRQVRRVAPAQLCVRLRAHGFGTVDIVEHGTLWHAARPSIPVHCSRGSLPTCKGPWFCFNSS